ncbi:MAG TPA: hypothetical protein VGE29_06855 [Prosthecobacter sp.]
MIFRPLLSFLLLLASPVPAETVSVPVSDQGWSIEMDAPAFEKKSGSDQGPNYVYNANSGRFNLSFFVEPKAGGNSHRECFEHYWPMASRNPLIDKSTIRISHTDRYYRVAYDIIVPPKPPYGPLAHRNVNYFFAFEDKWVDVHISIIKPEAADAKLLEAFDEGLKYGR